MPRPTLVIVGAGMAGSRLVEEILARAPERFQIRLFAGDLQQASERILLSGVLSSVPEPEKMLPHALTWYEERGIRIHAGVRAARIDRGQRLVVDAGGKVVEPYDVLVLATGAAGMLPIPLDSPPRGVVVFRTVADCMTLGAYARECERAVVVGLGALAEMAERGLRGLQVETIHVPQGELLLNDGVAHGVRRDDGMIEEADLVVLIARERPRCELAADAGLECQDGIVIDENHRTSDPHIYALGACLAENQTASFHEQTRQLAAELTGVGPELPPSPEAAAKNKVETLKKEKDALDYLQELMFKNVPTNNWQELDEDDKQRMKWHGLFFRKQTPGNFMLRLRMNAGQTNARQLRVIADLSDEFGKGFVDLTTRQQIQLRWFTLRDLPAMWQRLDAVGLHSKQTGMDNVRGVCGCPVAGLTPHELFDATPVVNGLNDLIIGNREFTNLPRKFNVTITGCLENCCHTETQDIALVPAFREMEDGKIDGFNVLVGGKQGSGGFTPARSLDVFTRREEAVAIAGEIIRIFRDHGSRATRNKARLSFLIDERGIDWFRAELERRLGRALPHAGTDLRKKHHVDHLGLHPQKQSPLDEGPQRFSAGLLVPVGRMTTAQLRSVADLAECYGDGQIRVTVGQNVVIANIPEHRIGAFSEEPLLKELPIDPSPVLRGLVACTGTDYCHMALIETKGWALQVARELEKRVEGKKVQPLSMHWSGCAAGCGLHQAATIGFQGCRSRVDGQIVDAAHVCVGGKTGPNPVVASDLMYDVPCDQLVDALVPLVLHLPR